MTQQDSHPDGPQVSRLPPDPPGPARSEGSGQERGGAPYPPGPARSEGSGQERGGEAREGEPDDAAREGGVGGLTRDATRRSLANSMAMWQWLETQEKQQIRVEMTEKLFI